MRILCIYAKPPLPGRTKSRLARHIGDGPAAALAAAMLGDLCAMACGIDGLRVQLWHPPGCRPEAYGEVVPTGVCWREQVGADLGERMATTFQQLLSEAPGRRILLVGSDCITFTPELLEAGFAALERLPVVLQPADDGGYVLVGQSRWVPELFAGIRWGSAEVLSESLARLREAGVRHCELPLTFDIDDVEDLGRLQVYAGTARLPRVSAWLEAHAVLLRRHLPGAAGGADGV